MSETPKYELPKKYLDAPDRSKREGVVRTRQFEFRNVSIDGRPEISSEDRAAHSRRRRQANEPVPVFDAAGEVQSSAEGTRPISKKEGSIMALAGATALAALAYLGPAQLGGHEARQPQQLDRHELIVPMPQHPNVDTQRK